MKPLDIEGEVVGEGSREDLRHTIGLLVASNNRLVDEVRQLKAERDALAAQVAAQGEEIVSHRKTIDNLIAAADESRKQLKELEAQVAESKKDDPDYIGSTTWKGWKVDLYQGDEDDND